MRVRKKTVIKIAILGIIGFLITSFGLYFLGKSQINTGSRLNRLTTRLFDYNYSKTSLKCADDVVKKKVTVFFNEKCIFRDGKSIKGIDNKHGWNCIKIKLKEDDYWSICHFKKNNWHVNNYFIDIDCLDNSIDCHLRIEGPDSASELYYLVRSPFDEGYIEYHLDRNKNIYRVDTIDKSHNGIFQ